MVSAAISGIGAVIKRGDGASVEAFTTLAEVSNIGGPDESRDMIEVTTLDSPSGHREFIGGFRDSGTIVLDMNWVRTSEDLLRTDYNKDVSTNYKVIMPDAGATEYTFAGWVVNITKNTPTDDKIVMTVTIKVDGVITITS